MRVLLLLGLLLVGPGSATAGGVDLAPVTPARTWALLKFAVDTEDLALFRSLVAGGESMEAAEFERFRRADGRFVSTSRVVSVEVEGDRAVLQIEFYGLERGQPFLDTDPMRMVRKDGRWLVEGL